MAVKRNTSKSSLPWYLLNLEKTLSSENLVSIFKAGIN